MINDLLNLRLGVVICFFLAISLLIRFLDYSFLYVPVMIIGNPEKAGFLVFLFFNYLPKMVLAAMKITAIAGVLYAAIVLLHKSVNTSEIFSPLVKITVLAEGAFLLHIFYRLVYFVLINDNYTLTDYADFNPLALSSLSKDVPPMFINLFNDINIFKGLQILILILGLRKLVGISMLKSTATVLMSYGVLFVAWEIFWGYL